ncbi:MAG TPA: hypothetical protein VEV17_09645 [Bryobacteraceae bacterium]|nr:hypothetical protein [Bryobacteraceae bacterium]
MFVDDEEEVAMAGAALARSMAALPLLVGSTLLVAVSITVCELEMTLGAV